MIDLGSSRIAIAALDCQLAVSTLDGMEGLSDHGLRYAIDPFHSDPWCDDSRLELDKEQNRGPNRNSIKTTAFRAALFFVSYSENRACDE